MPTKKGLLTTGDLARRTGNTLRTVRFYEEEGLLAPHERSRGGRRLFDQGQADKLQLISDMRDIGLSLPVIKEVFRIKHECHSATEASHQVRTFLREQIERLHEQIKLMQRVRDGFEKAVEVFRQCEQCKEDWMHRRCATCDNLAHSELPANVRMLWLDERAEASSRA
jgi:DNA-binding transcriptional MerR regulator